MTKILNINENWLFVKDTDDVSLREGELISLPHSQSALGKGGSKDSFRGSCLYVKTIEKSELPAADLYCAELCGISSSADLYVNGEKLAHRDGGNSAWRVNITDLLTEKCDIAVVISSPPNETVYPQASDSAIHGGIYGDVNIICASDSDFDSDCLGGQGTKTTPTAEDADTKAAVESSDEQAVCKAEPCNEEHRLDEQPSPLNLLDINAPEGRFSLNDKISDITSTLRGRLWFFGFSYKIRKSLSKSNRKKAAALGMNYKIMKMMGSFTVLRLMSMMETADMSFSKEELIKLNRQLNKIKKPESKK